MIGAQGLHDYVLESQGGAPRKAPDVVPRLGSSVGGQVPWVLYGFYTNNLMKPHGSVRVVRLGCGKCTNSVIRCFISSEGLNCRDMLEGMVHKFVELANGLRLSTDVPSQDLSGAWGTIQG
jgi:hypothetical protein